jgi:L-fuconolactonase
LIIIDAHQHFWDRSLSEFNYRWHEAPGFEPLRRDFLPADLQPLLREAGVQKTILVQTQHHLAENRWALKLAQQWDFIAGVVGWVDLESPLCGAQLDEFAGDPRYILRESVNQGLAELSRRGFPFDLLFYAEHLALAPAVARRHPELRLVIDHLSKPRVRLGELKEWARDLQEAAACPNVYCKLSGLVTEADWRRWTVADLRPYVETAIEAFTPQRIMFGSDWPVCCLAASYEQVIAATRELLQTYSAADQAAIWGQTAREFYRLPYE